MTGDAAGFAGEDRLASLRVARQLHLGGRAPARRGGAHGRRNVVQRDVHRPAERLEERRECPNLRAVEADRRLVHVGHDVRVALDDIGTGLEERPEDVLLGSRAGKTKPGMSAKQYILESLLPPGAYVVAGYPNITPPVG